MAPPRFSRLLFSGLLALAAILAAACGPPAEKEIKDELRVGLIVPLSGAHPAFNASQAIAAANMVIDKVNARGGMALGERKITVRLFVKDNRDNVDKSLSAARELINNDRVAAIIGPYLSRNAIRVAAVAEEARLPMITPTSTHPETTRGRNWVFRATAVDTLQGRCMAEFAALDLHQRKAAVLYDAANEYSHNLAVIFRDAFTARGGTITAFESFVTGETDFSKQLAAINASGAQAVFLPNLAPELELQVPQVRELGDGRICLGADTLFAPALFANPAFQGCYLTYDYTSPKGNKAAMEFFKEFHDRYKAEPEGAATLTHDSVGLLLDAVSRAGSTDPEEIRRAIATTERFQGASGTLSFVGSGDPEKSLAVIKIEDNQPKRVKVLGN